jgi:hypothetical protein
MHLHRRQYRDRRKVDEDDAQLLERRMRELEAQHRLLLWWCYLRQAGTNVVCRRLSITHKPATAFIDAFRKARAATVAVVEQQTRQSQMS